MSALPSKDQAVGSNAGLSHMEAPPNPVSPDAYTHIHMEGVDREEGGGRERMTQGRREERNDRQTGRQRQRQEGGGD